MYYVSATLTWLSNTSVRSYDVISAYFNGSGLSLNITPKISSSNPTLAIRQNYSFSYLGYGHVFLFNGNTKNIYDAMQGVDITI